MNNQFECTALNAVIKDFVNTLWIKEDTEAASAFFGPFLNRPNATASSIGSWMKLEIAKYEALVEEDYGDDSVSMMLLSDDAWDELSLSCSKSGVTLIGGTE